jgi:ATP-dependent HslUV protease ATP-binding subunit HslU
MERLLERISYEAADKSGESYKIDAEHVDKTLGSLVQNEDLSRYIL